MPTLEVVTEPQPLTPLAQLVEDYLATVRARGLSPKTIEDYQRILRRVLLPFCAEQRPPVEEPAHLTRRVLDRLAGHLLEQGGPRGKLTRFSAKSYLGTINHFLSWARSEGELAADVRAQMPRTPQRVLDILSRSEITQLERSLPTERDRLIIRTMADTGVRLSELTGLRVEDLVEHGRNRFLKVRGKGRGGHGQERLVPVSPDFYRRLRLYVRHARPEGSRSHIFLTARKKGSDFAPLQPRAVQDMVRWAAERAGFSKRVHPHLLRHSFATWCLQRGMNPVVLQRILGHSDLTMITRTYGHLTADDAADAMIAVLRAEDDY